MYDVKEMYDVRSRMYEVNVNRAYGGQLIRSSSSLGANYRATGRAKSTSDLINKFRMVEEEWMNLVSFWK